MATRNVGSRSKHRIGQGIRIQSQSKTIVWNVYCYFENLAKKNKGAKNSPFDRTIEATGIGREALAIILRKKRAGADEEFESPAKRYKRDRRRITPDTFDTDAIRRNIYSIYEEGSHVTLSNLLTVLQAKDLFAGGKSTLAKVLKEMGFLYRNIDNRRYYYEQPRIIEQRHVYLRRMRQNRTDKRPVVYLDETWANAHDGKERSWVEKDTVTGGTLGGVRRPPGNGQRLIILGAGGEKGWIPDTKLIFHSKKNTGDYHDEMTGDHFEEWFKDNLLPNCLPNSLIVMDNASYHSRRVEELPVKSWTKTKMIAWLDSKSISYPSNALKVDIWNVINGLHLKPRYKVDEMADAAGHEVVRLPVAHCTLNPIEMAWAQIKGYIKAKNRLFTLSEVERLAHEGFGIVTPEHWTSLIKHVQDKVEDHYWEVDGLAERYSIREFTIRVRPDDDSSEESGCSDVDGDISDPDSDSNDFVASDDDSANDVFL